jgi:hypothetical protein
MSAKNFFRCLLAVTLVLGVAPMMALRSPGEIPEEWQTLLEWHGNGGILENVMENYWLLFGVAVPLVILVIATQIGMFFFWRPARPAYAAIIALSVLLTSFGGISVMLPVETAFVELTLLLEGAVVALSYSQPFSAYFEETSA